MAGERLTRDLMAARVAAEFGDGWIVNLGVGMPTRCSDFLPEDRTVILHAENGVIGYGRNATVEEATPYVVNGGAQPVLLTPIASIVHHADAFAIIRSGLLDAAVLGAYEVATNGDFANWRISGRKGGGIGGAMDLAVGAKQVFLLLEHTHPRWQPPPAGALRPAADRSGRGDAGHDRPRAVRARGRLLPPPRDRSRLHGRRGAAAHGRTRRASPGHLRGHGLASDGRHLQVVDTPAKARSHTGRPP